MSGPAVPVPRYSRLSVLVPVFNERSTVGEVIRRMRRVTLPDQLELEIVVVDDGSTDGTDEVLAALEDSTVRWLRHEVNRGQGAAIRTGLSRARGDLVLVQDADPEYDPQDWPALLKPIMSGRATVVYGTRSLDERQTMPLVEHVGHRLVSVAADRLYNTNLTDLHTCYKLFDRAVLDSIVIEPNGFGFEPEVTAEMLRRGVPIYQLPNTGAGRPRDEGGPVTGADTARGLLTLARRRFGKPG